MNKLDQSIINLVERHDLLSFDVSHLIGQHRAFFRVTMQWLSAADSDGRGIAAGNGETIALALSKALAEMHAIRTCAGGDELADEALPEFAA